MPNQNIAMHKTHSSHAKIVCCQRACAR